MIHYLKIIFLTYLLSGCCTKKACECPEPTNIVKILFNYDAADSHSFPIGSESDFYSIRTNSNYTIIDSIKIILDPAFKIGNNYAFNIYENYNGNSASLQGFNFIIVNRPLGFADTLTDLSYTKRTYRYECNSCFLKKDYFYCEKIENIQFKNKNLIITGSPFLINRN